MHDIEEMFGAEARFEAGALAARQADIVGQPQRVSPLSVEDLQGDALEQIIRIRAAVGVTTLGDVHGYFLTMAKHPEVFRCQLDMGTVLFQGKILPRERELAVLRVGWLCRAPYEWGQHCAIARRYGVSDEEIARVVIGSAAAGWSAHEAAILRGVEELLADQMISDATWEVLAASWDEVQLIEFPMMVGQYVATAFVQNALRMRLEVDNAGLMTR